MNSKVEERALKIKRAIEDAQDERWIGPVEVDAVAGTLLKETETLLNDIRSKDAKVLDINKRISRVESTFNKINTTRNSRSLLYGLVWYEEILKKDRLLDMQLEDTGGSNDSGLSEISVEHMSKSERYESFTKLESLCVVVISHLECENLSKKDINLLQNVADLLVETAKVVLCFGRLQFSAIPILQCASIVIDLLHTTFLSNELNTGLNIISHDEIFKRIQIWEMSIKGFVSLFQKLKMNSLSEAGLALNSDINSALLEEVEQWNTAEVVDLTPQPISSPSAGNKTINLKIASHIFTYKIISTRFEAVLKKHALKQSLLFVGMSKSKSVRHCGQEGGFADVYVVELAETLKLPAITVVSLNGGLKEEFWYVNKVAVKVAKMDMTHTENTICVRVAREIRVWNNMRHENILPLIGLWKSFKVEGHVLEYPAPVSPYFEDGDLQHYIINNNISLLERLSFLRDISGALAYMHSFEPEVVHGDLRAVNVLVRRKRAYLCDFGLSHLCDGVYGLTTKAHGSERWLAPEHLDKTGKPTPEGDIYSFGSVMLEVLSGEIPWASDKSDTTLILRRAGNRRETAPRPSSISNDHHWGIIRQCWKISPELRPPASIIRNCIEEFVRKTYAPPAVSVNTSLRSEPTTVVSGIQIQGELTLHDGSKKTSK